MSHFTIHQGITQGFAIILGMVGVAVLWISISHPEPNLTPRERLVVFTIGLGLVVGGWTIGLH